MHTNDTVTKGTHSELLATTALLANGWDVAEPVAPRAFDLLALPPNSDRWVQIQVKTARQRTEPNRNNEVVVYAKKNNGKPYTLAEAEFIIGIFNNEVYMFPNREIGEYWVRPELINERWQHLPLQF